MSIKLAVFDLDGTLLDTEDNFRSETAAALKALYTSGIRLMICSGRVPSMAKAYLLEAEVKGFLCCAGGAYIEDENGNEIYSNPIDPELVKHISEELKRDQAGFSLMTWHDIHTDKAGTGLSARFLRYGALAKKYGLHAAQLLNDRDQLDLDREIIYKIPVLEFDRNRMPTRIEQVKKYSDLLEITVSGPHVIDLTAKGNSKGRAVAMVAERLGLTRDEICCMGDYDNDVPMFRQAGLSVAMGNAPEYVKAAADHVTAGNDENGAAEAIWTYLLPGQKGIIK